MRTLLPTTVVLVAAALLVPALASADQEPTSDRSKAHGVPLRDALDRYMASGVPGAVVLVRDGEGSTRITSGVGRLGSLEPVRATDRFRVGSLTKTYLATVVLQLVGEGRLSLQDTVERWLPGRVPNGENVTLRQLLTHTSGLGDYFRHPGFFDPFFEGDIQHAWSPQDLLDAAATEPPIFAPGAGWQYSNTGYMLLGHIVQALTGDSLEAQLQRRIIRPLRLRDTSFDVQPQIAGHHAHGYSRVPSASQDLVDVTDWSPSYAWSAGAIVSTADDTATFYGALLAGRVLRRDLLEQMQTTVPMGIGEDENYGLGLWHSRSIAIPGARLSCGAVWGHDGDILGYHADAWVRTDRQRVVVLLGTYAKDEYDQGTLRAQFDVLEAALCGGTRPGNG
jgi:D-alanyl-D-alanine carboxypeptidase